MSSAPEPGFDQILTRLREVVARLESGDLTLEQSLQIYEEGVQLARRGQHLLAAAERRVEILVSASGGIEVAPFTPTALGPEEPAKRRTGAVDNDAEDDARTRDPDAVAG
jgi:exodeoxyribonuclease VII small subunit